MSNTDKYWSPYANVYNPIQVGSIDGTHSEPHDNGIVRACNANYRPNPSLKNNPKATLFVGRLSRDVTEEDLEKVFSKHGSLRKIFIVRDIVTGSSKRYGFVEFKDYHDSHQARLKEHKSILKGKQILVDYECQHTLPGWVPRRLGGGFGGFKESGQLRFGCVERPWKKPAQPSLKASKVFGSFQSLRFQKSEHSKDKSSSEVPRSTGKKIRDDSYNPKRNSKDYSL